MQNAILAKYLAQVPQEKQFYVARSGQDEERRRAWLQFCYA